MTSPIAVTATSGRPRWPASPRPRRAPRSPARGSTSRTSAISDRQRSQVMKAITLHGTGDLWVESVADPGGVDPGDVVVRIPTSAICGSDLHHYHGRVRGLPKGVVLGHEV